MALAIEVINTRYEILETYPISDTTPYIVHKAHDVREGRTVTLKVLPAPLANVAEFSAHLRAAVRAGSTLNHPMILRTYDGGLLEDGSLYLVSDYIRGITLKERIRRVAPFSLAVATDIATTIAEALAVAHKAGVFHERLMPQCVTLTGEGQICVGDFAVARAVESLIPDGRAAAYLPPTVALDDPPSVENDIYALGAILHEMLTGATPLIASGMMPQSPRVLNPGIPTALEGITLKALHPDPDVRYQDAAALLADLQAARAALRAGRSLTWSPLSNARTPRPAGDSDRLGRGKPESAAPGEDTEYEEDVDDRSYRERPNALVVARNIFLAVFICACAALGYQFVKFAALPSDVMVPNLIGSTLDDANRIGAQKNFLIVEGKQDFSAKWPKDQIYAQDPQPGRTIKAGATVSVCVSEGPEFLTVPDLVGMTNDRALRALQNSTLPAGTVTQDFSETIPKGVIMSQSPSPDADVSPYSAVNYVISKGKQPPDPPSDVQADAVGPDRVQVSWLNADHADSYNVTRSVNDVSTVIASGIRGLQYVDSGLQPNTTYTYTVSSVNEVAESAQSDPTIVITPPPPDGTDNNTGFEVLPSPDYAPAPAPDLGTNTPVSAQPPKERQFEVAFRLPLKPGGDHRVRIEVQDDTGTTLVYDEIHHAGDRIDTELSGFGSRITFRVLIDDALMKQQTL